MVVSSYNIGTRLLTVKEAARILNVHENTVRRWCDQRMLKSLRISTRGDRRIPEKDVRFLISDMRSNHGLFPNLQ